MYKLIKLISLWLLVSDSQTPQQTSAETEAAREVSSESPNT